jgi:hypothetical protein
MLVRLVFPGGFRQEQDRIMTFAARMAVFLEKAIGG